MNYFLTCQSPTLTQLRIFQHLCFQEDKCTDFLLCKLSSYMLQAFSPKQLKWSRIISEGLLTGLKPKPCVSTLLRRKLSASSTVKLQLGVQCE